MKRFLVLGLIFGFATAAFASDPLLINGAGATFPYPLYSKWFSDYHKQHADLQFNYQSIGSGGGIQQITKKTVDFGASDAPMTHDELAKAPDVIHIPTVLGADVLTYNGLPDGLKLTPEVVAGMFLGTITKWNDAAIVKENSGTKLPDLAITIVHRSDGSGTTAIFTDYLSKVSSEWKDKVGAGKSVSWPAGLGAKGNEGVTGLVKQTPGAIGYVELAYANQNKLPVAAIRNRAGEFIKPTTDSVSKAASGVSLPEDFRVSITDAAGPGSYPIAAFTYILVRKDQTNAEKGEALVRLLWWATHDGQKLAAPLDYAPLPEAVVKKVETTLKGLTVQGKALPSLG